MLKTVSEVCGATGYLLTIEYIPLKNVIERENQQLYPVEIWLIPLNQVNQANIQ